MAFAMETPFDSRHPKKEDSYFRNQLWRCYVVLRHSRAVAEKVLDGSISLRAAFAEARTPQRRGRQEEKSDSAVAPLGKASPRKSTPSLPTFKSMQSPADKIDPTELKEFLRTFAAPES